jgi:hypothetical protein
MRVLKRLGYGYSEAGNGDHCNDQSQGEITHRLFEIGFRRELRKNVMRHRFSMRFRRTTVNSGALSRCLAMIRVTPAGAVDRCGSAVL